MAEKDFWSDGGYLVADSIVSPFLLSSPSFGVTGVFFYLKFDG
jgi:hypothetical protein